jgi:hypothetical protein
MRNSTQDSPPTFLVNTVDPEARHDVLRAMVGGLDMLFSVLMVTQEEYIRGVAEYSASVKNYTRRYCS